MGPRRPCAHRRGPARSPRSLRGATASYSPRAARPSPPRRACPVRRRPRPRQPPRRVFRGAGGAVAPRRGLRARPLPLSRAPGDPEGVGAARGAPVPPPTARAPTRSRPPTPVVPHKGARGGSGRHRGASRKRGGRADPQPHGRGAGSEPGHAQWAEQPRLAIGACGARAGGGGAAVLSPLLPAPPSRFPRPSRSGSPGCKKRRGIKAESSALNIVPRWRCGASLAAQRPEAAGALLPPLGPGSCGVCKVKKKKKEEKSKEHPTCQRHTHLLQQRRSPAALTSAECLQKVPHGSSAPPHRPCYTCFKEEATEVLGCWVTCLRFPSGSGVSSQELDISYYLRPWASPLSSLDSSFPVYKMVIIKFALCT
ncbi:serine/arginine repetitive matrix protein 1-like [Canis lupus familiaris]|uniref:serine/arginine repetitive matrix protein 1-like n=1 Tax=Canis lupus familiaris TaxID=9615 RepID=UPI0018F48F6E|nr:serine/arginine repetitive matrix protein 1-like [Canis lupus familiaris]